MRLGGSQQSLTSHWVYLGVNTQLRQPLELFLLRLEGSGAQITGSVLCQAPPLVGFEAAPLVVSFLPPSVRLSQRPYFSISELLKCL